MSLSNDNPQKNASIAPLFPTVVMGRWQASFLPEGVSVPSDAPIRTALVFAIYEGRFVTGNIAGRGWCIPGGHLEEGETPEQAVRREAWEEIGATLGDLHPLGHYLFTLPSDRSQTLSPVYVAEALRLGNLPAGSESLGVRAFRLEELPERYFTWDPLIEAVFAYAWSVGVGR